MRIISWNVNGIRASWSHGLSDFLDRYKADIYAFQETKTDEVIPMIEKAGYYAYWSFCTKRKGYSGTLCLTKRKPLNVTYTMGVPDFDTEGRLITLEFEDFFFVNTYFPNSQHSEKRCDYRAMWDFLIIQYLMQLRYQKPVVMCGDFNVTVSDRDIYQENKWVQKNAEGFVSDERESLEAIINTGYVDTYRLKHPDEEGKYTWWSNRLFKRRENKGWRLDYFLVSEKLRSKVMESTMLTEVYGSDHCPIVLDLDTGIKKPQTKDTFGLFQLSYTYDDLLRYEANGVPMDYVKRTDMTTLWESIDWDAAEKHLEAMQMALAKSAYSRDPDRIEKWQKRIVYSIDAKLLAVRHVCASSPGAGVDMIKWKTPHEKMSAALSLTSKGYKAMPSRLLLVKSKNGKQRRIHIETYYDHAMQCLYAFALDPIAESWGDRKSYAYRKGRSTFDMNEHIKNSLSGENAPEWVFIGDIRKCYENISHDWIMKNIPMSQYVLKQFLEAGYVFAGEMFPMDTGIGIGCSISPIIANMTLDGMQDYVYSRLYPEGGEIDYANGNMVRYADDVLFTARTRETAQRIRDIVAEFLNERGLELSIEKCRIVNINETFDFMSRTYFKRNGQVFTKPSTPAMERFMTTMRETIENYTGSQKSLIEKINQKIDGWATYHKTGEADFEFRKMDIYINALLLDLSESKHPKWPREKVIDKYFMLDAKGRHRYALPNKKEVMVKALGDTILINYFPAKTKFNPYIDLEYLEIRTQDRQKKNVTGLYRTIWERQEGRCYYCGHRILFDEEKTVIEAEPDKARMALRMAYVHNRCIDSTVDYIDSEIPPSSINDVMELLEDLSEEKKPQGQKYMALSEYFRTCTKNSVTLTLKEIEDIMGDSLGLTSQRKEFWYRTGQGSISQCWLDNGYEIKTLHLEDERQRVTFRLTSRSKNTASIEIPEVLLYGRVPNDAKYEVENYLKHIVKKYGL